MTDHSDLIAKLRACATARTGENPYQMLSQAADALSSQSLSLSEAREEIERLKEALKPFAAKAGAYDGLPEPKYFGDTDFELNYRPETRVIVTLRDLRHARSALENGPAVLADAHTNPPLSDLSSLRKGAEVVREALEDCVQWLEVILAEKVIVEPENEQHIAASIARARAALVSGSREDGA